MEQIYQQTAETLSSKLPILMLINNHHIHIESYGPEHGHTVVLLHQGLGSTHSWRRQVPALVEADFRVITYDRWGYGQSEARPYLEIPSFRDDLADLGSILSTLRPRSTSLIGHSDGGTIALYFAAQHPEQVTSLVTIAAHIYLEPKMETGVQMIRQTFEKDENFRAKFRSVHGDKYEAVFHNWFDGWHTPKALDWDMRPLLAKISCPTLVIQGENDEHATLQHVQDITDGIAGSELWVVPGAAHMLPLEIPKNLNKKLLEFLGATTCQTKK